MYKILIGGRRKEVGKLFELLLWKPNRAFTNVYSLDQCVKQAKLSSPDLLIIDNAIDTPERCFNTLVELKESRATAEIPIVLLTASEQDSEDKARLLLVADDHIQEPFNPGEIKTVSEQFL